MWLRCHSDRSDGKADIYEFEGEGRSRQEDVETSCRPGWARPKQTPSPLVSQPRAGVSSQVRSYSEHLWGS